MKVWSDPDGHFVQDGDGRFVAGPFATQAEAWKWIDTRDQVAIDMEDTRKRVSTGFSAV